MKPCPYCQASEQQVKNGRNPSGSQRYKCRVCERIYTLKPKPAGYDAAMREQAIRLYLERMNLRRIARILSVNHQSVANWVNAQAETLPDAPMPESVDTAELDELFTYVEQKKHRLHHDHRG